LIKVCAAVLLLGGLGVSLEGWAMGPAALKGVPATAVHAATHTDHAPASDQQLSNILPALSLPPVAATREVIAALPPLLAAKAGVELAQARSQRLQAGVHEWAFKAGAQQRSDAVGDKFFETDLALERGVRFGRKGQTDKALGEMGVNAGQMSYADTWHETVRTLVQAWFEAQRARAQVLVLAQQTALAGDQLRVAQRRVKAGDAPRMDEMMARAELERAHSAEQQARGRLEVMLQELRVRYPGLALDTLKLDTLKLDAANTSDASGLPALPDADTTWLQRIMADNHELELAEAEAQVARLAAQRAQLDTRPDPLVGVRAARERGGAENVVGVYITVPISGALRTADARAAQAQADAAEQRLALTRQKVEAAAQRAVLQARHTRGVWERQQAVLVAMAQVAQLSSKAYALGEVSLTESLQARRNALDASLNAQAARWDALEAITRLLVDAHQLWAADEH
jgi:cobalt-zinc-cadmium efflux system outer membrane protein